MNNQILMVQSRTIRSFDVGKLGTVSVRLHKPHPGMYSNLEIILTNVSTHTGGKIDKRRATTTTSMKKNYMRLCTLVGQERRASAVIQSKAGT